MSDGKAPILLNNLDSWLISYILYTLLVMLVCKGRPATYSFVNWAYLVFSGFAFVKWFYFREERINLHYIWLSNNKKLDCRKILLYSFFLSFTSIHPFFKTYWSLFDCVLRIWTQSKSQQSRNLPEKREWETEGQDHCGKPRFECLKRPKVRSS